MQGIPVLLPISLDKIRILGIPSEEIDGQAYCSLKMLKSSILKMLGSIFLGQLYFNKQKKNPNHICYYFELFSIFGVLYQEKKDLVQHNSDEWKWFRKDLSWSPTWKNLVGASAVSSLPFVVSQHYVDQDTMFQLYRSSSSSTFSQ